MNDLEPPINGENKPDVTSQTPPLGKDGIKPHGGKRLVLYALASLLILSGAGGGLWWRSTHNQKSKNDTTASACSTANGQQLLKEAASELDPAKNVQLKQSVDKIMKLKNYDKDANCLNVITTYYINISDYDNAKISFDRLTAVYDPKQGFSAIITQYGGLYAKNFDTLKANVAFGNTYKDTLLKSAKKTPASANK